MKIVQRFITKNPSFVANVRVQDSRYLTFQKRGPIGLVLHSVGAAQPKAENIAAYFDNTSTEASTQAVLQADGTVLQLMPWNYRAWHVAGAANNTHVGVEMTEPGPKVIRYDKNNYFRLEILNKAAALAFVKKTYAVAVELFAQLCLEFSLNPKKDGVILSHSECYKRGIGSNHGDPEHLWNAVGSGFTMDGFRKDVKQRLEEIDVTKEECQKMIDAAVQKAQKSIVASVQKTLTGTGSKPSAWIEKNGELAKAKKLGITDATRPQGYAKREEVAAMVLRAVQDLEGGAGDK